MMQIHSQWNSTDFGLKYEKFMHMEWNDYEDFINKYMSKIDEANTIRSVTRFFEGIGVLVHRGLLDATLVDDLISGEIVAFWEKICPTIMEYRKRNNWPQALEWVEYLYNQVKPLMEEQHPELKDAELKYQTNIP